MIPAESVTTEFNTLFETVTSIAEKVDPIKLNQTLTSAAQALTGLGDRFGESLEHANVILDDLNPRMPRLREDTAGVADLADVYTRRVVRPVRRSRFRGHDGTHAQRADR